MLRLGWLIGGSRAKERIGMRFCDVEETLRYVLHKFGYGREFSNPMNEKNDLSAWLFEIKRGKELGEICADRELEKPVYFSELPHPARASNICYKSVEILDPALTELRNGMETGHSLYQLKIYCTVSQAEMLSLEKGPLKVQVAPKAYNPLAQLPRTDIMNIETKKVRLFWVRIHPGAAGNERADELTRNDALTKADYDRYPLIHTKRPRGRKPYKVLRETEMASTIAQAVMGHSGFGHY
ncbi:hypothetical protein EVAR_76448_1 [Eumeta japonica]|uniref:RNase H type-1 domain-containing protein n=1 Tax=Eumeta variegata TaxID=151549 RepID=A0A4C1TAY4_EUMVA|nr:hypothetical protein EVAR_76448_1 [Eumeta japonica]